MKEEFLEEVVVYVQSRRVVVVSSLGDRKVVDCDTFDEFMGVLNFVRSTLSEGEIKYTSVATAD